MSREIYNVTAVDGATHRYALDVFLEGEHWTSTVARLDAAGNPDAAKVAPRFYGTSEESARRRMISVLESQFEEVKLARE